MAKEKLKVRKKKSGGLRPEERSKGVEEKKTAKNTVMGTGLCCNFCVIYSVFLALSASLRTHGFFLWTDFRKTKLYLINVALTLCNRKTLVFFF